MSPPVVLLRHKELPSSDVSCSDVSSSKPPPPPVPPLPSGAKKNKSSLWGVEIKPTKWEGKRKVIYFEIKLHS
jgi:hypothetical protein